MSILVRSSIAASLVFAVAAPLVGQRAPTPVAERGAGTEPIVTLERFIASETIDDPNSILPNDPNGALGLLKKPVETPRSMSVVSSEMISNLSL
jgi:hypothetical protein